ncbi:MAG: 6-bladed beta-propeller [Bacteroidia bacterium]|nr:6-bladed beta-propeller [Bacteroidia bacterium]
MKIPFILILISGLLTGCGHPGKKVAGPFHPKIILDEKEAPEEFENLVSDFRVIPIEYSADKIIGEISKVVPDRQDFLVLDNKGQSIKRISQSGKITGSFSHEGKAAGEYLSMYDFAVHPVSHEVILLDGEGRKIIYYDSSGKYLREFKIDFWALRMAMLSDDRIICLGDRNAGRSDPPYYHLNIIDLEGRVLQSCLPYYSLWLLWVPPQYLAGDNNEIFVVKYHDYNLYRINQQMELDTAAVFDFGTYSGDTAGMARLPFSEHIATSLKHMNEKLFPGTTFIFDSYCYLETFGKDIYRGFGRFDRDLTVYKGNKDGYLCFYEGWPVMAPGGKIGNGLISWIDPVILMDIWDRHPVEKARAESNPEFKKIIDQMDIEGNPVLMLYRLKRE